jgi:hypothetical protein
VDQFGVFFQFLTRDTGPLAGAINIKILNRPRQDIKSEPLTGRPFSSNANSRLQPIHLS